MISAMFRSITTGTRRRLRLFGWITGSGTLVGVVYGSLIGYAGWGHVLIGGLIGAVHGVIIASVIGLLEVFGGRTAIGRRIERAPLTLTILIKGIIYGAVIAGVELGAIGEMVVLGEVGDSQTTRAFTPMSISFSFFMMFIIIFTLQISRLVGGRTLGNLVLGRYHQPRMEERFVLFVDIVGSTRIAERIGPISMHRFLNRVFALIADPIADHHGEIYQYVGDEIVITWKVKDGRIMAQPLACFFAIQAALNAAAGGFAEDFDVAPALRGALHVGPVAAGEVGVNPRSIVFHGDLMNVTARLEQATRELECPFLVSGQAIRLLEDTSGYRIHDHGPRTLRGRQSPMRVFEVSQQS